MIPSVQPGINYAGANPFSVLFYAKDKVLMNLTTAALLIIAVILVATAIYSLYSYLKERRYKKFPTYRR